MTRLTAGALAILLTAPAALPSQLITSNAQRLVAARALPPEVAGRFRELANLQQADDGSYYAFDRRSHAVSRINETWTSAKTLVAIGQQKGELLEPSAFDSRGDQFIVSDAPFGLDRLQIFFKDGTALRAFQPSIRSLPRLTMGGVVLNGAGSLEFGENAIYLSEPDSGWLVTEYAPDGVPRRYFGRLRSTGHETDIDVHLALNTGMPLLARDGTFWFVFQAGVPLLRKYDAKGELLFERHIEGTELDPIVRSLPSTWPRERRATGASPGKPGASREFPLIEPNVQTAAVHPDGGVWVALSTGHVYVYDATGDKRRVLELTGVDPLRPTSLAFSRSGRLIVTPGGYEFDVR